MIIGGKDCAGWACNFGIAVFSKNTIELKKIVSVAMNMPTIHLTIWEIARSDDSLISVLTWVMVASNVANFPFTFASNAPSRPSMPARMESVLASM